MATFKDACFHYQKLTKLNNTVLKLGANSVWRPAPFTKYKGWCLDCCQYTNLTYCKGCSLYHVCQWCVQYNRCFLDDQPHLLRMRTFMDPVSKSDLDNILIMYNKLFPINKKVIDRFVSNVKQNKCRSEYDVQWYNQLLMPITLQALTIKVEYATYYIFGYYDDMTKINQTPFSFTNFCDDYDKLILDSYNFDRMEHLPMVLQQEYAMRYFNKSRFLTQPVKEICKSNFTEELYENRDIPTSPINVTRNCVKGHSKWKVCDWNKQCMKVWDTDHYFKELATAYTEHYAVSQRCLIFMDYKLQLLVSKVRPNYICSNHHNKATKVRRCRWCTLQQSTLWDDFRMKEVYDLVTEFLRVLVKSNTNVGHCSSMESIYDYIPYLFNPNRKEKYNEAVSKLFVYLEPVEIKGIEYVLLNYPMSIQLRNVLKICGPNRVPSIMSEYTIGYMIKLIIAKWFDVENTRLQPLTLTQTNSLYALKTFDKLTDEYALLISDDES
ncbi:NSP1 [Rotavirus A]|uniref:Non-structural protein 1 n=1 Tax=Rotavirus A TaxID=28875 RepID=A0A2D0W192_9REOV|nr:NSP1 [Rotavirus A]